MGHNEDELPKARRISQKLGMEFIIKLNRKPLFSPIKDNEFVRRESGIGVATRDEFIDIYREPYSPSCYKFWTTPQINWDGKLLGCGCNIWQDYGNVFKTTLKQCLNHKNFIHTKRVLLGKDSVGKEDPCYRCPKYKDLRRIKLKRRNIVINFAGL